MRRLIRIVTILLVLMGGCPALASDWYVAPGGVATNQGSEESPWDIASTFDANPKVKPGDTIFLLPGTYKRRPEEQFDIRLTSTGASFMTTAG